MIVVDCEQRSPAWYAARAGLLTATGAAAMLSKPKKAGEDTAGKEALRVDLALESLLGGPVDDEPGYENADMRRGRAREPEGVALYEAVTGELVQLVGFLRHDTLPIGCSPDGIVGDFAGGLELKCPKRHTHFRYLQHGTLPSEYRPQVLHSLYVTDLPWWDFCSYCPEMPEAKRLFRVRVHRGDVELDAYALAVQLFLGEVEHVTNLLRGPTVAPELVHA